MMYVDFSAGGKEYKLRLNTRSTVQLEKQLGCNPLSIFGAGDTIPTITTLVHILHCAMQPFNHSVTLQDAYNIMDEWLDEGNVITDFLKIVIEVYKVSGLIKVEDNAVKN